MTVEALGALLRSEGDHGLRVPERILVVGAGAREHALAWRLSLEPGVERVLLAPLNVGAEAGAEVHPEVALEDHETIARLARERAVGLVVVGPEGPLVDGLADELLNEGISVFGPEAAAARIEGSKAFCREVATEAGVPMAEGAVFEAVAPALDYARELGWRVAVKADGLAAGKGVFVCDSRAEVEAALLETLAFPPLSASTQRVVVERVLEGREASVIAICDGTTALALPAARDHKRLGDGDRGPNTGGMGAYSPVPDLPDDEVARIVERFHLPILAALRERGTPFRGALYAGLMLTDEGLRLLEFNARFGDPEAQVILPRVALPLAPLLLAAAEDRLADAAVALGLRAAVVPAVSDAAVGVVLATPGYPERAEKGAPIEGIPEAEADGAVVFYAGVARREDRLVTAGGRVLTVVAVGGDIGEAADAAYRAADRITFSGRQLRRDIGRAVPAPPVAVPA